MYRLELAALAPRLRVMLEIRQASLASTWENHAESTPGHGV